MRLLPVTGVVFAGFGWAQGDAPNDLIKTLVGRLDLERYKATIKALTKFGDRREGTDRNRAAVDWIEAQLKSYGCTNTERIHYETSSRSLHPPPRLRLSATPGGGVIKGELASTPLAPSDPEAANDPDARLRQLNMQPSKPGPREATSRNSSPLHGKRASCDTTSISTREKSPTTAAMMRNTLKTTHPWMSDRRSRHIVRSTVHLGGESMYTLCTNGLRFLRKR